jgi:hypothetical protein
LQVDGVGNAADHAVAAYDEALEGGVLVSFDAEALGDDNAVADGEVFDGRAEG